MPKKEEEAGKYRNSSSSGKILEEFDKLISDFKKKYKVDDYQLIDLILGKGIEAREGIPVDVFNAKLGCLEAIVKYLRENKRLDFKEIAELVNRSSGAIVNSYSKAKKKFPEGLSPSADLMIPVEIFANKKFSILENLVVYLKDEKGLRFREIGKLIERNEKTVWTVYKRALIKK